ncbi:hypothetical protein AVEN_10682-1 [Araneus ventricosus]|uniref:Uncharacterized protein n=1 Tax=Araneus ventricosus TaxID=182803 RepID=A0A4Y2EU19_ARAVE|nr:hypothetical protein AVEN_10682-1 [Araneus ventricosus]
MSFVTEIRGMLIRILPLSYFLLRKTAFILLLQSSGLQLTLTAETTGENSWRERKVKHWRRNVFTLEAENGRNPRFRHSQIGQKFFMDLNRFIATKLGR